MFGKNDLEKIVELHLEPGVIGTLLGANKRIVYGRILEIKDHSIIIETQNGIFPFDSKIEKEVPYTEIMSFYRK